MGKKYKTLQERVDMLSFYDALLDLDVQVNRERIEQYNRIETSAISYVSDEKYEKLDLNDLSVREQLAIDTIKNIDADENTINDHWHERGELHMEVDNDWLDGRLYIVLYKE